MEPCLTIRFGCGQRPALGSPRDRFKLDAGNRLKYKGESERLNLGIELDGFAKSPKTPSSVIPVKTGIQEIQKALDSRSPPSRGQASRE